MRHLRRTTTLILIGALLLGGFGLARNHARDGIEALARSHAAGALLASCGGVPLFGVLRRVGALPIGTTIEVAFFDADPATGATAVTTLALTVGVDSEVAFAAAFAAAQATAAAWDATFLVVSTGTQVRTVNLPLATHAADPRRGALRGPRGAAGLRLSMAGHSEGAATAVVTIPPRSVTFDSTACSSDSSEGAASTVPTTTPTSTIAAEASEGANPGPQTPACGIVEVTTSELIAGIEFPAGRYQINTFGISCEEVMGDKGLFNTFLQLEDTDELPEPWSHLEGAVGAPKFVTGPGVGFRAERLAD
jgi:hypothetical protein